jgi:SHS family lactate transporter-like MFS transporter
MVREQAAGLTRDQRNAFLASWLGWAMDAFDYFLLVFVLTDVAKEFDTSKTHVSARRWPCPWCRSSRAPRRWR